MRPQAGGLGAGLKDITDLEVSIALEGNQRVGQTGEVAALEQQSRATLEVSDEPGGQVGQPAPEDSAAGRMSSSLDGHLKRLKETYFSMLMSSG